MMPTPSRHPSLLHSAQADGGARLVAGDMSSSVTSWPMLDQWQCWTTAGDWS
eukprot:m.134017 g.134017  ORF g.134017 m.134017 type:complete len:52 (-) comp22517_c0_seq1:451-606(-)